ncbi:hypothetical protein KIPB_010727, partial [Kipferlia bialata]
IDVTLSNGMWNRLSIEANGHVLATRTLYVSDVGAVSYPSATLETASHNSRCVTAEYRVQVLDSSNSVMDAEGVCRYLQAVFNGVETTLYPTDWEADTCVYDVVFPATSASTANYLYFDVDGDAPHTHVHYDTTDTFTNDTEDGSLSIGVKRYNAPTDPISVSAYPVDACGVAIPDLVLTVTIYDSTGTIVATSPVVDTASDAVYTYSSTHGLGVYTVTVSVDGETAPALTVSQPVDVTSAFVEYRGAGFATASIYISTPGGASAVVSDGTWLAYTAEGTEDTRNNVYLYQTDAHAAGGMLLQQVIVPGGHGTVSVIGRQNYSAPVLDLVGDLLVIGCSHFNGAGTVFIYRNNGSEWVLDHTFSPPDGTDFDVRFGMSVHLANEDTLIIGAQNLFLFSQYTVGTGWSEIEAIIPPMKNSFVTVQTPSCVVSEGWVFIRCSVTSDVHIYDTSVTNWHKTPGYTITPSPQEDSDVDTEVVLWPAVMSADMSSGEGRLILKCYGLMFNVWLYVSTTDSWNREAYGPVSPDDSAVMGYATVIEDETALGVDVHNYVSRWLYNTTYVWYRVYGGGLGDAKVTFANGSMVLYGTDRDEISIIAQTALGPVNASELVSISLPYGADGSLTLFDNVGYTQTQETYVTVLWDSVDGMTGRTKQTASWSSATSQYTIPFDPPVTHDSAWVMSVFVDARLVQSATYYIAGLETYWVDYATVSLPTLSPCQESEISVVLTNNEGLTVSVDLGDTLTGSWDSVDPISGVYCGTDYTFTFTAETPATSGSHTFNVYVDGVVVGSATTTTAPVLSDEYTYMYLSSDHVVPGANVSFMIVVMIV